jgi:hypothetical protein
MQEPQETLVPEVVVALAEAVEGLVLFAIKDIV